MKGLLLAILCFVAFLFTTAACSHLASPRRLARVFVASFSFWILSYSAAYLLTPKSFFLLPLSLQSPHVALDMLYGCLLFCFFFHSFLCSYYVLGEGFSTSFLPALRHAGKQGLTEEEVVGMFQKADGRDRIIGWRLPLLAEKGYIRRDLAANAYTLTPKGMAVARLARFLKRMLNLGPGG